MTTAAPYAPAPGHAATPRDADLGGRRGRAGPAPRRCPCCGCGSRFVRGRRARRAGHRVLRRPVAGAADRRPLRAERPRPRERHAAAVAGPAPSAGFADVGPMIALAALGFGVVLLFEAVFGRGALFWPIVHRARRRRRCCGGRPTRRSASAGSTPPAGSTRCGWSSAAAAGRRTPGSCAGGGLVVVALVVFAFRGGSLGAARDVLVAGLLGVVGLAIVVGPWVFRLASDLADERAERVRTQERADVAAHLHDSVLQTLALIQKNAGDGPTVARLARAQERDLRAWLYDGEATDDATLAAALRAVAAEVEDAHGVVGRGRHGRRRRRSPRRCAPVRARHPRGGHQRRQARRHRPGRRVRRGRRRARSTCSSATGAPASTPTPSPRTGYGVRGSIIDRMERHGGTAEVRSHARRGHRGAAAPAAHDRLQEEDDGVTDRVGRHRRRPRDVPRRRARRARAGDRRSRWSPRPRTSTRRSPRSPSTGPTSCCSTCTCPAAAASR